MKKLLLLGIILFAMLASANLFGQTKKAAVKGGKPAATPVIKTSNDSVSYVLGQQMVQGLPQYLVQLGVLADTAKINNDYQAKIATADAASKAKLEKELKLKVDSMVNANNKNRELFLNGFDDALNADASKNAYYAGAAIVSQIKGMMTNASEQILGNANALNKDAFMYAFKSEFRGSQPLIIIEDGQTFIQQRQEVEKAIKEKLESDSLSALYADKIAEGKAFLDANKSKSGVVVLPSGLQYKVEVAGNGAMPKLNESVTVHYKGTLIDGTVFDSSYERGEPATFAVGQLIKGFNEALLLMSEGSKWTVYIPYDLAYGTMDRGTIKPFSDLIFEIELIKVGDNSAE